MNNFLIGISGVARSGKDTFAELLEEELKGYFEWLNNFNVCRKALAYQLKKEANQECLETYKGTGHQISTFTKDETEKALIRPFLVKYGKKFREQSQGTYWTDKVQKEIEKLKTTIIIVTDIRYAVYKKDEVEWIKKNKGLLVHVTRYDGGVENKILPPNEDEAFNDPILEALADFRVVWPTTKNENIKRLFAKEFIRRYGDRITENF